MHKTGLCLPRRPRYGKRKISKLLELVETKLKIFLFLQNQKTFHSPLSDPMGKVAKLFNVPTSKGGKIERFVNGDRYTLERGITTKRWTFLISKKWETPFKKRTG